MNLRLLCCLLVSVAWPIAQRPAAGAEITASASNTSGLKPPERVPQPQLQPASDEPLKAMAKFKVAPDMKVSVWAAEPMLGNPVAFCLDEKGVVYTAETYRYRTSALDIRHYMFMLEDDLASRSPEDRIAYTKKNFPNDWQKLGIETEVVRRLEDIDGDWQSRQIDGLRRWNEQPARWH
jgi:quinoprotein glucose dehydrogenase